VEEIVVVLPHRHVHAADTTPATTRINANDYQAGDKTVLFYWRPTGRNGLAEPARSISPASPNPHVGFGAAGPHFSLARSCPPVEITVMLRELLGRVPGIAAAGAAWVSGPASVQLHQRHQHLPANSITVVNTRMQL